MPRKTPTPRSVSPLVCVSLRGNEGDMTIRWGIVGCGDVCEVKSGPALYRSPGSSLQCVMRRDAARAREFAERHGAVRHTTDAQALISDPAVDVVYVATPPGTHLQYALEVAAAGKPCLVEKPMARTAMECRQMIQAFERAGQPLFVAYYRRALPRFLRVREILESGDLGTLISVQHDLVGLAPAEPPNGGAWRTDPVHSGGGLFLDLGSHVLDLMDFLLGPIASVSGCAQRRGAPRKGEPLVEDSIVASLRFPSGVVGTLSYAFNSFRSIDRMRLLGTRGSLSFSVFGTEPLELLVGKQASDIPVEQPAHVHQPLVESIVQELSGQETRCSSRGRSALRASQAMDAILGDYYAGRDDAFWSRPETWPGAQSSAAARP